MGDYVGRRTIRDLQALQDDFVARRGWYRFHTPRNIAQALAVEAAELLRLFQWGCGDTEEELVSLTPKIMDELADVQLFVVSLASSLDLDLESAVLSKLRKNESRWPESDATSGAWVDRER